MGRASASATVQFGLVAFGVKFYLSAKEEKVSFRQLHEKCKCTINEKCYCKTCDTYIVDKSAELLKGYEIQKDKFLVFTPEEIKSLDETGRNQTIDILEFVPLDSVDLLQVEKSYFLGADKGADKPYRLLSTVMAEEGKVAVGKWHARGKDQLVLIRAYQDGLLLHQCFYANEMRAFEDKAAPVPVSDVEKKLAKQLIANLESDGFDPAKYHDEYAQRVAAAVQTKSEGKDLVFSPTAQPAAVVDLVSALQGSLAAAPAKKKSEAKKLTASTKESATKKKKAG